MNFTAEVFQNEFVPPGTTEVHAVVTVTATGTATGAAAPEAAEVIMLDASGSMGHPPTKIASARRAATAAVDELRDGVWFAVVRGTHEAVMVYPQNASLVRADATTRAAAARAIGRLTADGGTAIGTWLTLARDLMATRPDALHHAILLTDGKNEHEEPADLAGAIAACEGRFQCDCRGVGDGWVVDELRRVSTGLLGSMGLLRGPDDMVADFRTMITEAMGRGVADVGLRVWVPQGATVRFVRQVSPSVDDLTGRATQPAPRVTEYPTGAWGVGSRDYHVCVDVPPAPVGGERLAARVGLVVGSEVRSEAKVRAVWTEDADLSARIDRTVAHYTGQADLAAAVQEGLAARRDGDEATALGRLGEAARLAAETGDESTLRLLARVVDIDDPVTGTVRLRRGVEKLDEMELDASSTRTVRARR